MAIFYVPPSPKEREAREEEWDRMIEEAKMEAVICEVAADIAATKGIVPSMAGYECVLPEILARDAAKAEQYLRGIGFWPVPEEAARKYQARIESRKRGWTYEEVA